MRTQTVTSSIPSFREILAALFKDREKILRSMAYTFGFMFVIALVIHSRYAATTSLVVTLGPEYTYRPEAGAQSLVNAAAEREQILATEIQILQSPSLIEDVIRKVGLERLYPDYVNKGPIATVVGAVKRAVSATVRGVKSLLGMQVPPPADDDPVKLAVEDFQSDFDTQALRIGNVIELSYKHRDPDLAAETLNTLVAMYLERRQKLFNDVQAPVVNQQLTQAQQDLADADRNLREFKQTRGISNFDTQMDILLHQQGDLEKDRQDADNLSRQTAHRVQDLKAQLATTPVDVAQYSDTDTGQRLETLQDDLDQLRAKEIDMRANYLPESRPMVEIHRQIADREAAIAKLKQDASPSNVRMGRNTVYDAVSLDLMHAEADLNAQQTRLARDEQQLQQVRDSVAQLNQQQIDLQQLERQRTVLEDKYKDLVKTLGDRQLLENVDARRSANVHMLQPADVPIKSTGVRKALVLGGLVLSLLVGIVVAVFSEYSRRGYLSPESVERSLGLPVLVSIPDGVLGVSRDALAGPSVAAQLEKL